MTRSSGGIAPVLLPSLMATNVLVLLDPLLGTTRELACRQAHARKHARTHPHTRLLVPWSKAHKTLLCVHNQPLR
eukprot:m.13063 g.13063  ORF g.13063 m.13063 type:complete len:75 (-) comp4442_c0_seq1:315-539(-)